MEREKFGSRLGFILTSAGCAIGLGNVWKFPYVCGQSGGAAFILLYLLFLVLLGFPIMVCEFSVGRASQKSCATSFRVLQKEDGKWHRCGYLNVIGNYVLMMFYTMVAGWMLYYFVKSVRGDFTKQVLSVEDVSMQFGQMQQSPGILIAATVITIVLAFGVCALGVQKGIEKVTKVMMSCLLVLIIVLAVNSCRLPGAAKGIEFYLVPSFQKMKEVGLGNVVFSAMSQAFFTLSVGMGSMAIFGSYLDKSRSLAGESMNIMILDTFVALMAGLIIIPACFAFGINPDSGPSLIFITLPNIFNQMAGGRIWGSLFFLFMSFAALSTVIAVFENIVSFGIDLFGLSREKAVLINIVLVSVLTMPCVLGFNILSFIQPLGSGSNIMDLEDFIVTSNVLPLGSIIYVLFCTTKAGWGWDSFIEEANAGNGWKFPKNIKWYMTFVIPAIIVVIYLKGYYDLFAPKGLSYLIFWMAAAMCFLLFTFHFVIPGRRKKNDEL